MDILPANKPGSNFIGQLFNPRGNLIKINISEGVITRMLSKVIKYLHHFSWNVVARHTSKNYNKKYHKSILIHASDMVTSIEGHNKTGRILSSWI